MLYDSQALSLTGGALVSWIASASFGFSSASVSFDYVQGKKNANAECLPCFASSGHFSSSIALFAHIKSTH
jgi:hypothetical protein